MELPKLYKAKVKNKQMLNRRDLLVDFDIIDPPEINSKPGQFINLNVSENTFRAYSICSNSLLTNLVSIVVSIDHDGAGSVFLRNLQIGDEVKFIGPSGKFSLPNILFDTLVFFATGTGIAPFIPMWHKLINLKYKGNITVYFGIRSEDELFFVDKLDYFKKELNFEYKICVSQPTPKWGMKKGRVTELFDIKDFSNKQYFLCGHPLMIGDMIGILQKNSVLNENIYYERFTVSNKKTA